MQEYQLLDDEHPPPPPPGPNGGGGGGGGDFCKLQCAGAANQRRQFLHLACNRWGGGGGQTILQTRILNNVDKSCNSSLSNKYLSNLKYYRKSNCTPKSALKCIMQKLQMSGMHPSPPPLSGTAEFRACAVDPSKTTRSLKV